MLPEHFDRETVTPYASIAATVATTTKATDAATVDAGEPVEIPGVAAPKTDFEDAAVSDRHWGTMRVTAGVTEELGSEINVIFTIDAPHVEHASIAEATEASEDEDEATAALVGGKSLWTARVSKESRVKNGAPLELSVDTRYLQFFDPDSGLSIGHPKATTALAD